MEPFPLKCAIWEVVVTLLHSFEFISSQLMCFLTATHTNNPMNNREAATGATGYSAFWKTSRTDLGYCIVVFHDFLVGMLRFKRHGGDFIKNH